MREGHEVGGAQESLKWGQRGIESGGSVLWATMGPPLVDGSPLPEPGATPGPEQGAGWLVRRSGVLDGPAFMTWSPQGWEALEQACEAIQQADQQPTLVIPHADDILSDVQRCMKFADKWCSGPSGLRLLIDPESLMTESMLPKAADHLLRMAETILDHPGVEAIVLPTALESPDSVEAAWRPVLEACEVHRLPRVYRCPSHSPTPQTTRATLHP